VNAASFQLASNSELHPYLDQVLAKCPLEILEYHRSMNTQDNRDTLNELGEVTESRLIGLHKEIKETLMEYQRS
jgi:hypothetical protein